VNLTIIILTYNEEIHLERCIKSFKSIGDYHLLVVDSFSTDQTLNIAQNHGARILQNPFKTQSSQFNWALSQLSPEIDWVLRIDADEYLTPELSEQIRQKLPQVGSEIDGIIFGRRMTFQGKLLRYGGVFPVKVLRLFRYGRGQCEERWMDEHIKVQGQTLEIPGEIIDDNLNSLTWWTEKHNRYSSREAVDLLNLEYGFMPHDSVASLRDNSQASIKRWLKEAVYAKLPGGLRAFAYFFYRYIFRLGFLDGSAGTSFHFLQGFWYRYLVDTKVAEVKRHMKRTDSSIIDAIQDILSINLNS
jgi:glycosyltransferase involved in cell wall biosynthesis